MRSPLRSFESGMDNSQRFDAWAGESWRTGLGPRCVLCHRHVLSVDMTALMAREQVGAWACDNY